MAGLACSQQPPIFPKEHQYAYSVEIEAFSSSWLFTLSLTLEEKVVGLNKAGDIESQFSVTRQQIRTARSDVTAMVKASAFETVYGFDRGFSVFLLSPAPSTRSYSSLSFVDELPPEISFMGSKLRLEVTSISVQEVDEKSKLMDCSFSLHSTSRSQALYWVSMKRRYGSDGRPFFADVSVMSHEGRRITMRLQRLPPPKPSKDKGLPSPRVGPQKVKGLPNP